jgi:hypothetical protein
VELVEQQARLTTRKRFEPFGFATARIAKDDCPGKLRSQDIQWF